MDEKTKRVGWRRVQLVQRELTEADQYGKGTTFFFEINGVRMFMGGMRFYHSNSIFARLNILPRIQLDSG
jgi:beta-mannosidase